MDTSFSHRRSLILSVLAGAATLPLASRLSAQPATAAPSLSEWMSWRGGVDLVGLTDVNLKQPNIIIHLAQVVHTPVGSAASGMVFFQPDPDQAPLVMGFVSTDPKVGAYFGPHIFKGTPFENAAVLGGKISIDEHKAPYSVSSKVALEKHVFEVTLEGLAGLSLINRPVGPLPFAQQGLEAVASKASLKVNGKEVPVIVPMVGMSGGGAAVWAPMGLYAR